MGKDLSCVSVSVTANQAKMKITALSAEQQAYMRQKVLAYDIFRGKKPWVYEI